MGNFPAIIDRGLKENLDRAISKLIAQVKDTEKFSVRGSQVILKWESPGDWKTFKSYRKEEKILSEVVSSVREKDTFFDIGSAKGIYSMAVGVSKKDVDIYCFEPREEARQAISRNSDLNDVSVNIKGQGLSYKEENVRMEGMRVKEIQSGQSKLVRGDSLSMNPDVMKIDVEGHELKVLKGFSGKLEYIREIFIELHEEERMNFGLSQEDLEELRTILDRAGFNTEIFYERGKNRYLKATNEDLVKS